MPSPEICNLGTLSLRWYGVFAALAAITCYLVLYLRSKRYGFSADNLADLLMCCVITGVIGARLEYVRRMWDGQFASNPLSAFRIWEGGLVFQGGFILAAIATFIYCRHRKWPLGNVCDLMAVALPCGHAVARIGCFLNGCCFGKPLSENSPWGIIYPAMDNQVLLTQQIQHLLPDGATAPLPVLPVQLIESAECLLIAGIVLFLERRKSLEHFRFYIYLLLYCLMRIITECWRGDYLTASLPTPAQKTTLFIILPITALIFAWTYYRHLHNNRSSVESTSHDNTRHR